MISRKKEIWRKIDGFEYEVSNQGRVRRLDKPIMKKRRRGKKLISPIEAHMGYGVFLYYNDNSGKHKKKWFKVKNLVADYFLLGSGEVKNIDGDEKNNRVENLKRKQKVHQRKLTDDAILVILQRLKEHGHERGIQTRLAEEFGVTRARICMFQRILRQIPDTLEEIK